MKIKPLEVLKPTAILVIICVLITAAVAGTNELTKDKIAQQQALKAEESRKVVLPEAVTFEHYRYAGSDEHEAFDCYVGRTEDGFPVGIVYETSAKGYGGDVKVMTGIRNEARLGEVYDTVVSGVVILEHSETPGLGANAEKEDFRSQYVGLKTDSDKAEDYYTPIEVVRYQKPEGRQIEAMTGASITSRAVTAAVNEAISEDRVVAKLMVASNIHDITEEEYARLFYPVGGDE